MESFLCVIFCNWTSCLKNFFLSSLCVGFKNKLNSFRFVVSPPCCLHFLSNKATNFVSSFGFLYWFGNYFFDNSLCSNLHSISIESRVLNKFFQWLRWKFFFWFFAFLNILNIWSAHHEHPLKNLFEWRADSGARFPNFPRHYSAHKLFVGSFYRCLGSSSWRTVAHAIPFWFD